jgi:hypothetical protein
LLRSGSGQELLPDGLEVEDGRALNGIEFRHMEASPVEAHHTAEGAGNVIGTILASLREDSDGRPVGVVAGVASSTHDFALLHLIEAGDFDVTERVGALERLGFQGLSQDDARLRAAPIVVDRLGAPALHTANCLHFDLHEFSIRWWVR